ncbi:MAG: hypothetical protein U0Q21_11920 [Dermatophilaceae bacterium]
MTTTPVFDVKSALSDGTPFYAALGVTDLAIERMREVGAMAQENATKSAQDVSDLPTKASDRFDAFRKQLEDAPQHVRESAATALETAIEFYEDLANRGEKLVDRIRNQQATKDLVHQVKATESQAKGAMTTARKSVEAIEESAMATLTTGTQEVRKVAVKIAESVSDETKLATSELKAGAERTRAAARKTATTTRKSADAMTTKAKAATTSARKSAAAVTEAAKDAAAKVGA